MKQCTVCNTEHNNNDSFCSDECRASTRTSTGQVSDEYLLQCINEESMDVNAGLLKAGLPITLPNVARGRKLIRRYL